MGATSRVRAGVKSGLAPFTESDDFEPEAWEGGGRGGKGGIRGAVMDVMDGSTAAPLVLRGPDSLRPLLLCFELELVAERTDLTSPSLTTPKCSCDCAFWDANEVGDSTTVFRTGMSSWGPG